MQTCFPGLANSCKEVKWVVIDRLISYWILQMVTLRWITELKLEIAGWSEDYSLVEGQARKFIHPRSQLQKMLFWSCLQNIRIPMILIIELEHLSEEITQVTCKASNLKRLCMREAKKVGVSKIAVSWSTIKQDSLYIDNSSPLTKSLGSKRHWLLVVEDCSDHAQLFFERSLI